MGGNSFDDKKNDEQKDNATSTPASTPTPDSPAQGDTPAAPASTEGASVETGDATQGGEPQASSEQPASEQPTPAEEQPAAPAEAPTPEQPTPADGEQKAAAAAAPTHEQVSGIQVRLTGAIKGQTVLPGETTIGDAIKAMGHTAPSNYTLRDEVTSSVLKLSDPISSLSKGATITSKDKGGAESSAGMTSSRRAAGG